MDEWFTEEELKIMRSAGKAVPPKVLNRRNLMPDWEENPGLIYVGRPSPWGNPVRMGRQPQGDYLVRWQVIALYEVYAGERVEREPRWLDPLRGATALVCWCAPRACHADVLVELLGQ